MALCGLHSRAWVILFALLLSSGEALAENGRVFGRSRNSINSGRFGGLSIGQGQQLDGASNLAVINANQTFNINGDGSLAGVLEQRSDQTQQGLRIRNVGGRLLLEGLGGLRPEAKTVQDVITQFGKNRNRSNRPGVIDRFIQDNTGNALGVAGLMKIDLSSIPHPDPANNPPGSPEQMRYALATLNSLLNSLSNSSTLMRVFPKDIRKDPDGKAVVTVDLRRFFGQEALNLIASSDPTSACTGRLRLQSMAFNTMFAKNYYQIKGLNGFNRDQIFAALGVEGDKRRTLNNKILIAARNDPKRKESGVTTSTLGRVSKFLNMGNNPGGTCYETDDFVDRAGTGAETNSRDVKQVGINYTHDASEVLCHQRNGFMLGMLFNSAGVLQTEAPANIATGGTLGPAVSAAVSCMDCHAKGFLAGGKRIHDTINDGGFYDENFDLIPGNATVFRNQFGQQLNGRAFFTTNQRYRQRANRDTAIFFRALAKSGSLIVNPKTNYPMPLVPLAVHKYGERMTNAEMAAELGVSEQAFTALVGGNTAGAERRNFDNAFCGLKRRLGAGNSLLSQVDGRRGASVQRTSLTGNSNQSLSGIRHIESLEGSR